MLVRTVRGYGSTAIIVEKSRFIASVHPASTEEEGIAFIQTVQKKFPDASHHCYAYMIGDHDQHQKAYDDGEPGGTAGKPILEILKNWQLKHTVVVVTRYFGGTKLGRGGLIRAYGQAAKEGLLSAGLVQREKYRQFKVAIAYAVYGKLEHDLQQLPFLLEDTQFTEHVQCTILAKEQDEHKLLRWIAELTQGLAECTPGQLVEVDRPLDLSKLI